MTHHIQKACKPVLVCVFTCISLLSCGSASTPQTQSLSMGLQSVSFQNNSCSNQLTILNSSTNGYTLAFLSAAFSDKNGKTYHLELDQTQVRQEFDPDFVGPGDTTEGNITFDLESGHLSPPISVTLVMMGLSGDQVVNFVGNFTCE